MQRQGTEQPVEEVEHVHALVDHLTTAGDRRVGAPFLLVADPPAVTVAAAGEHHLAVITRERLADRPRDAGMEAVVEADLDPAPGILGGPLIASTSAEEIPAGFSTRTLACASSAAIASLASRLWVVATMTTSGSSQQKLVGRVRDLGAVGLRQRCRGPAVGVEAGGEDVGAEGLSALAVRSGRSR